MGFQHKPLFGKNNPSYKHGMSESPTWNSWNSMHSRCKGRGNDAHYYKNIKVCERWNKFENFLEDMGERPKGRTLDRINGRGNYEPSNCRWATAKEQAANTTRKKDRGAYKNSPTFMGKSLTEISKETGICLQTLRYRFKNKLPLFEAVKGGKPEE